MKIPKMTDLLKGLKSEFAHHNDGVLSTMDRISIKVDKLGVLIQTQRQLLEDVCNSFENLGCEGCGTVDIKVINRVRKFLGWNEIK